MKLLRILYLLFAVILFTTSCSRTNEKLLQAEQLIESSPDSAMTILNKYSYNKLSDKDKALYGLVYMQVRDKKVLPIEPDSFLDFSISYYKSKNNDNDRLGLCYLYRGRDLKYNFRYEKAMEYYLKALDELNGSDNYLYLGRINSDIGFIFNVQRDFDKSREKYADAYDCYIKANSNTLAFYSKLNIGRAYHEEKKYDLASNYYKTLLNLPSDSLQQGALLQEVAINLYDKNALDSAVYFFRKVLDYPYIGNNYSIRCYYLSELYFELHKLDTAALFAQRSLVDADIRIQKECYRILVNCKTMQGEIKELNHYMSKYQDCADTIQIIDTQLKGSVIEKIYTVEKKMNESRSWIWYLSIFALIIIVFSISIYVRKHRKGIQTIKTIEEKQLVQKKESVQEIVDRTKEALHQSLKEKRNELTKKIKQNTPDGRREMILQLYDELVHFKNKQHFKNEMDNTLNNLYTKLETGHPKLKTKEKQWACLNMLEIPNEESMQLLDYNTEAYKKMKQRFAQKIGVYAVANIDAVLEKILYDAT